MTNQILPEPILSLELLDRLAQIPWWQAGGSAGLEHGIAALLSFKDTHLERM
jgi:hypothetical protein